MILYIKEAGRVVTLGSLSVLQCRRSRWGWGGGSSLQQKQIKVDTSSGAFSLDNIDV